MRLWQQVRVAIMDALIMQLQSLGVAGVFELVGCMAGLYGSWLISENSTRSKWGWVAFLISNACIATFAVLKGAPFLLLMQAGFTLTSLRGIKRWFFSLPQKGTANTVS